MKLLTSKHAYNKVPGMAILLCNNYELIRYIQFRLICYTGKCNSLNPLASQYQYVKNPWGIKITSL